LESYFTDRNKSITQADLLKQYPDFCCVGQDIEGAFGLSPESLAKVGADHGFAAEVVETYDPRDDRDHFIITTEGDKHCVRVRSQIEDQKFEVMDPNINRESEKEEITSSILWLKSIENQSSSGYRAMPDGLKRLNSA
jgi:hypothetical protein